MAEEQNVQATTPVQQPLPNATAVLVLGIISIPTCICVGIVGLIVGIIALILGGKAKNLYTENPDLYTDSSYSNMKAGRVCAIIGVCLSSLYLIYYIIILAVWGTAALSLFSLMEGMPGY